MTIAQLKEHDLTGNLDEEVELRTKTGTPVPLVDFRIVGNTVTNPPSSPGPSTPVPEPSAILLLASGLAGFAAWRRTRKQS